jgi:hypothetical protein
MIPFKWGYDTLYFGVQYFGFKSKGKSEKLKVLDFVWVAGGGVLNVAANFF